MSQETVNTNEELDEVENTESDEVVSDSSSEEQQPEEQDQEIDFAAMSKEELEEFAKNERAAKQRAVANLRQQADKRRQQSTDTHGKEEVKEEDIESRIDKIVEQKLKEKSKKQIIEQISEGKNEWLYDQSWADPFLPETKGSDKLYVKLMRETERLVEEKGITDKDGYQRQLRIAAAYVLERPEPLIEKKEEESPAVQFQRRSASRPSVSARQETKRKYSQREIEIARLSGHTPEEVYK